jgi:hypothetical protein
MHLRWALMSQGGVLVQTLGTMIFLRNQYQPMFS